MKNTIIAILITITTSIFAQKAIAQEKEKTYKHPEVQSLIALGRDIHSGEVHLIVNEQMKGNPSISTKEYQVLFYRTGEIINIWKSEEKAQESKEIYLKIDSNLKHLANSHYNILNITDSMQYVYNGEIWCIIDHKNKKCEIDTAWCKMACSFPFYYPDFLMYSEMFTFYIQGWLKFAFDRGIENIEKRGDTTFLERESNWFSPRRGRNKHALYAEEYVWNVEKSVLLLHKKVLKDEKDASRKTIIMEEMKLVDAYLNDEKYANPELYDGLNYAKSYKIKHRKYPRTWK